MLTFALAIVKNNTVFITYILAIMNVITKTFKQGGNPV